MARGAASARVELGHGGDLLPEHLPCRVFFGREGPSEPRGRGRRRARGCSSSRGGRRRHPGAARSARWTARATRWSVRLGANRGPGGGASPARRRREAGRRGSSPSPPTRRGTPRSNGGGAPGLRRSPARPRSPGRRARAPAAARPASPQSTASSRRSRCRAAGPPPEGAPAGGGPDQGEAAPSRRPPPQASRRGGGLGPAQRLRRRLDVASGEPEPADLEPDAGGRRVSPRRLVERLAGLLEPVQPHQGVAQADPARLGLPGHQPDRRAVLLGRLVAAAPEKEEPGEPRVARP